MGVWPLLAALALVADCAQQAEDRRFGLNTILREQDQMLGVLDKVTCHACGTLADATGNKDIHA